MKNNKLKILLVDDNEIKISSIKREILDFGIDSDCIDIVTNAASARKSLSSKSFDLMILDMNLPARDHESPQDHIGVELLKQIIEDEDLPSPRIILGITAYTELLTNSQEEFNRLVTQVLLYDIASSDWKESLKFILQRLNSNPTPHYDYDVCFISALKYPEQTAILDLHYSWSSEEALGNGLIIREGQVLINGKNRKIITCYCKQMGFVTAAITTQLLIHRFRPRLLFMNGICGGVGESVSEGDIIIADKTWDWQSGKWQADGNFDIAPDQKDADADLIAVARAQESLLYSLHESYKGKKPPTLPKMHVGPMISGSSVVADPTMHTMFKQQHRKTVAIDMECYGVYLATTFSDKPAPKVLCIKGVSDLANRTKSDDLQPFCSYISTHILDSILRSYFSNQ